MDIMDFRYLDYMHDVNDFFTKIQKAEGPFVLPKYDIYKWDTYMSFDIDSNNPIF